MSETADQAAVYPDDAEVEDVMLGGRTGPNGTGIDPRAKEAAIMSDSPVVSFTLPTGKEIRIYAKSEGQSSIVELAKQTYYDALADFESRRASGWKKWRRRRKAMEEAVFRIHDAKLNLLRLMLDEPWLEDKHQEISNEDFRSIAHDQFVSILRAYRVANDVEDILREMDPNYEEKKTMNRAILKQAASRGEWPSS